MAYKYRYVVKYTENPFHDTDYSTMFNDFKDSALFLRGLSWHMSAKCSKGDFGIKSVTLQHRLECGKWEDL